MKMARSPAVRLALVIVVQPLYDLCRNGAVGPKPVENQGPVPAREISEGKQQAVLVGNDVP